MRRGGKGREEEERKREGGRERREGKEGERRGRMKRAFLFPEIRNEIYCHYFYSAL
jgi:hypothetical protein